MVTILENGIRDSGYRYEGETSLAEISTFGGKKVNPVYFYQFYSSAVLFKSVACHEVNLFTIKLDTDKQARAIVS